MMVTLTSGLARDQMVVLQCYNTFWKAPSQGNFLPRHLPDFLGQTVPSVAVCPQDYLNQLNECAHRYTVHILQDRAPDRLFVINK